MKKNLLAALLGAIVSLGAQAEGVYAKASIGSSEYHTDNQNPHATAVSLGVGYDFDKTWGAELGYVNLGKVSGTAYDAQGVGGPGKLRGEVFYLAGVGNWEITEGFSLIGKLGIASDRLNANSDITSWTHRKSFTEPFVGLGIGYQFTKELTGTIEYSHFGNVTDKEIPITVRLSSLSVGLKYNF